MDSTPTDSLLARLLAHSSNAALLSFLDIAPDSTPHFVPWDPDSETAAYDEGGRMFFGYATALPPETKHTLQTVNVLVAPHDGVVFGVHYGRCTFFHRCDFARSGVTNSDDLRHGGFLDGDVNITCLGPDWAMLEKFFDDDDGSGESQQLLWAYEMATVN